MKMLKKLRNHYQDKFTKVRKGRRTRMPDKLLTIKEVARILRISERTIYNKVRPNSKFKPFPIPVKRVGQLVRFEAKAVQRYIDEL